MLSSLLFTLLLLAAARAGLDLYSVAQGEVGGMALPLWPAAFGQAALALLAPLSLAAIAWRIRFRSRGWQPLPLLLASGVACLIAAEWWIHLNQPPPPPPAPPTVATPGRNLLMVAGAFAASLTLVSLLLHAITRRCGLPAPGRAAIAIVGAPVLIASGVFLALSNPAARFGAGGRRTAPGDGPPPPNVVLIVLDTVRADRFGCYGLPLGTTPDIDRIAREGTTFINALSPAPWTLPAHASLFTGLYPSEHGAHYGHMHLDDDVVTTAELLSELGYVTAGFSKKAWLSREMGTLQGFGSYRDFRLAEPAQRLFVPRLIAAVELARSGPPPEKARAGGEEIAGAVAGWIRERAAVTANAQRPAPFFVFTNFNEAHLPYLPRRAYFRRYVGRVPSQLAMAANADPMTYIAGALQPGPADFRMLDDLYVAEIAFLDRQLGRIFAALEETGEMDHTILIVTSDHGENIGDHDLMGHVLCVYDTLLRVPLLIRYPQRFVPGRLEERAVQLTDLLPTLVDLIDPAAAALLPPISGQSLVGGEPRRFSVAEYHDPASYLDRYPPRFPDFDTRPYRRDLFSLSVGDLKLIEGGDGRRELYDLNADPGERSDLAALDAETAAELARVLAGFRERLHQRGAGGAAPELDEATLEELRSLGYIQ